MKIEPFEMERWQSLHENEVELNLSDSGVHPVTLDELVALAPGELADLQSRIGGMRLVYTQTNGTPGLRELIAGLYPGATPDNVEVTTGGVEANCVAAWTLVEPGDEVVTLSPNYGQLPGLVRGLGATVKPWSLRADWERGTYVADLDELGSLVGPKTRMILLCSPNNPTGAVLDSETLDGVAEIAARHGTWVLSDEIYQGSELDGEPAPSMWGRGERVVVTNSLSKSYGLPGLRLGWLVADADAVERFWERHDYTTIGPSAVSDLVATHVLVPEVRGAILERTRRTLRESYELVVGMVEDLGENVRHLPPRAGAMAWLSYAHDIPSRDLAERLRVEKSVLVVPGSQFGEDGWIRIGFGAEPEAVREGLGRIRSVLDGIPLRRA